LRVVKRGKTGLSGQPHLASAGGTVRRAGLGDLPAGAVEDATAIGTPPDAQVSGTGATIPATAVFLGTPILGTDEGLQDGVHVVAGPLDHPNGAVKSPLASFDDLEDEELKQRVAETIAADLLVQGLEVSAVLLRIEGQEVAVGVGVVEEPGEVDFLGLAHRATPFGWDGSDELGGGQRFCLGVVATRRFATERLGETRPGHFSTFQQI
jgi:hypothetical protein